MPEDSPPQDSRSDDEPACEPERRRLPPELAALVRSQEMHVEGAGSSLEGLSFVLPALDALLPNGTLPRGVTELASPRANGLTGYAARLLANLHTRPRSFAAWIDPESTLYAPALHERGVDLRRLLVVRPPRTSFAHTALKLARSGAFDLVILDVHPSGSEGLTGENREVNEVFVRKLALASSRVLLLTDTTRRRSLPWPVAMRLEIHGEGRFPRHGIQLTKDRFGRIGAPPVSLSLEGA